MASGTKQRASTALSPPAPAPAPPDAGTSLLIGYARVSTEDQRLDLQFDALALAGCHRTFEDRASGARADRPGLAAALSHLRRGDTLVAWRLDRLARGSRRPRVARHTMRASNSAASTAPPMMCTERASTRNGPRGNQSLTCAPSHCPATRSAVSEWNAIVAAS